MLSLIRLTLILLIILLVIRAFKAVKPKSDKSEQDPQKSWKFRNNSTGVPKGVGEYTDYEEIDKKKVSMREKSNSGQIN
jgi:hypothetical protein